MQALLEPAFAGFLRASFQAALLVPAILALQRIAGARLSPAVRHALWWVVLLRLALPWTPPSPVSVFNLWTHSRWTDAQPLPEKDRQLARTEPTGRDPRVAAPTAGTVPRPPPARSSTPPSDVLFTSPSAHPAAPASPSPTGNPDSLRPSPLPGPDAAPDTLPQPASQPSAPTSPAAPGRPGWTTLFATLWAGLAAALLVRLGMRNLVFLRELRRTRCPVPDAAMHQLHAACRELRMPNRVHAWETPLVQSPAVCGLLHPSILLPAGFTSDCTPAQLRHVFLHELAHLRRGDLVAHALTSVVLALHWFNPLVWLAAHRIRLDREIATDALALSVAGESEARAYGRTIVHVLERWMTSNARPALVGILENPRDLQQRIRAIAAYRRPRSRVPAGVLLVAAFAVVTLTDAQPAARSDATSEPQTLLQLEFVGLRAVHRHPDLPAVQRLLNLPESAPLGDALAGRLAQELAAPLGIDTTPGTLSASAWTALLRDVLDAECLIDIGAVPSPNAPWSMAARLDAESTRRVTEAVARLRLHPRPSASAPSSPTMETVSDWTLIHSGAGAGPASAVRNRLRNLGRGPLIPGTDLFQAKADLAPLATLLGWPKIPPAPWLEWPTIDGAIQPRQGRLHTRATLRFPQPLGIDLTPWQIPTGLLHDPLISFTAMQGADRWLDRRGIPQAMTAGHGPRQAFAWSLAGAPWQQYFASPTADAARLFAHLTNASPDRWLAILGWPDQPVRIDPDPSSRRITLTGIPYFRPFVEQAVSDGRPMLHAGLFPPTAVGAPPAPAALLAQVAHRTNLLLYAWETTGTEVTAPDAKEQRRLGRLPQLRELAQFERFLHQPASAGTATGPQGEILIPGSAWIDAATPLLGDTVTELTLTGPTEVSLTRQSQLGLDAAELIGLLAWIKPPEPRIAGTPAHTSPPRSLSIHAGVPGKGPALNWTPTVIDAETRQPITDFELLAGTPDPASDATTAFQWQPLEGSHPATGIGTAQSLSYWSGIRFAVFASGGRVAESPVYTRGGRVQHVFEVRRRAGLQGRILAPDGTAAPWSTVIVPDGGYSRAPSALPAGINPSPDNALTLKTDELGRFTLPPLLEGSRLLAVHPTHGYAELPADGLSTPVTLRLQPFGRIEGVARIGARPVAHARVEVVELPIGVLEAMDRPWNFNPWTTTDAQGRFVLEDVPPGTRTLLQATLTKAPPDSEDTALLEKLGIPPGSIFRQAAQRQQAPQQSGFLGVVHVAPGRTVQLPERGPGLEVTGTLIHPNPHAGPPLEKVRGFVLGPASSQGLRSEPFASDLERRRWIASLAEKKALHPPFSWSFGVQPDGSFRIEGLLAGTYNLFLHSQDTPAPDDSYLVAFREFTLPAAAEGSNPPPLDLGPLQARHRRSTAVPAP